MTIPFLQPNPSRLSQLGAELALIEESGIYSNYGPVNTRFEQALTASLFGGVGGCLTVCNATIGLMVALRHAVDAAGRGLRRDEAARRRYVIMPSFTF
ncbi:MAG: DegT/DnrJ/EryC1/StrS family aminotransferase, partial [Janthinobacterium lividum]